MIYAKQGKFSKALEYNKRVISVNAKDAEGYNNLGLCYKNLNLIEDSISSFKEAIRLNSTYADAYYNLSNVYDLQGNYNYSFEANLQAVTYNTKNIKAYTQLGVKMMARGRNEDALAHLESGRALAPDDSELGICYSTCLIRLDRCHEAKNCLNEILKHDPDNSDAYTNLGHALMYEGNSSEAVLALEKAISLNETNAKSHFNLSQIKKYTENDPHLQLMKSLHESCSLTDNDRCLLCFALGKAFGDIGDLQKEFLLLKEGNACLLYTSDAADE